MSESRVVQGINSVIGVGAARVAIIADLVPRLLVELDIFKDGGLDVNIGEFSEIIVYQIFLIYLLQVIYEKDWPISTN
ncbi:MAG: hypothetical protein OEM26_04205 [Saprospiraceae bacterium]|nr:hypothetical protein [Saprospiraceae bacterium]